jgi:hypothetical protein
LSSDDELDFSEFTEQHFQTRSGERYPVSHPLLKAFLVALAGAWPDGVDYQTLLDHALPLAKEYGYMGEADAAFMEALLDFCQFHGVRLHTEVHAAARSEAGMPQATVLARIQAESREWPVTTMFHQALDLDEWGRWLITVMDGKASLPALGDHLAHRLADHGIQFEPGQPDELVTRYLAMFRRCGIADS